MLSVALPLFELSHRIWKSADLLITAADHSLTQTIDNGI
jgi:hypothetical protein